MASDDQIVAISASESSGGKHLGDTKVRYAWSVSLSGTVHNIEFTNSKTSGKKRIFQDDRLVLEQKVYRGGKFEHSWAIGNHLLSVVPKTGGLLESTAYELRINGLPFESYARGPGRRASYDSGGAELEDSGARKSWGVWKGAEGGAPKKTGLANAGIFSRMGGEERKSLQAAAADDDSDEAQAPSRSWGARGKGLLAGSDEEPSGQSPVLAAAMPLADSKVVLPTAGTRSKSEGRKSKRKSKDKDPFAAFGFPPQGDPFGAGAMAASADPWGAFAPFAASSTASPQPLPASPLPGNGLASPSPGGSSQGGFPAWPTGGATDSFSSSAAGSPMPYNSFHGSSASASPAAGEALQSPSMCLSGRKPLPTQALPWEPQVAGTGLPVAALQQGDGPCSPGSTPEYGLRQGLLGDDSDQDSVSSGASNEFQLEPPRSRMGSAVTAAAAEPSAASNASPATASSAGWPAATGGSPAQAAPWPAASTSSQPPPPAAAAAPAGGSIWQSAQPWAAGGDAAKTVSPWASAAPSTAPNGGGAVEAAAPAAKPSPWDVWPGAAKAAAPTAAAPSTVNPWGVSAGAPPAGAAPKAPAPAEATRFADPWGALPAAKQAPFKQAAAVPAPTAAPCPWA